jgi:recombination protein RecT
MTTTDTTGSELATKVATARDVQKAGGSTAKTATVADRIQGQRDEIARALPRHIDADRFTRIVLTQVRKTPKLAACEWPSLAAAIMGLAQVGLEPDGRNAHLVPYGRECTPIIDYRGYMELARRSGQVADIYAEVVRDGDVFRQTLGLHRDLVHEPAVDGRGDITHAYAVVRFVNGGYAFVVLDRDQIDARRARSKTAGASHSPWKTDEEAMTLKTAIRALAKYLPYSPEIAQAEDIDRRDDRNRGDDLGGIVDNDPDVIDVEPLTGDVDE